MDVWQITLAALRRWYVLVPLLALTAFGAMTVGNSVNPEYQARASLVYVYGPSPTDLPNPYEDATGANAIVGIVLNSVRQQRAIADAYGGATYEVSPQSRSTITEISTRADTADDAELAGVALVEAAKQELAERQEAARIPEAAQIRLQVLEPPTIVAAVQNGKMRIQAVVGVLGAALSLLVAVLFDDIAGLIRRARAKGRRRSQGGAAPVLAEREAEHDVRNPHGQPSLKLRHDLPRSRVTAQVSPVRAEPPTRRLEAKASDVMPYGGGMSDDDSAPSDQNAAGDQDASLASSSPSRRARPTSERTSEVARES